MGVGGMTGGAINWLLVLIFIAILPLLAGLVTGRAVGKGFAERGIRTLWSDVTFACFVFTLVASVWVLSRFTAAFVFMILVGFGMAHGSARIAALWISILLVLAINGLAVLRGYRRSIKEKRGGLAA